MEKKLNKFGEGYAKKIKRTPGPGEDTVIEPFRDAQRTLLNGKFSSQIRTEFFNDVFLDIIIDLFNQWLQTEPHALKEREYLYHAAMALGSVNEKMHAYEMAAKNVNFQALEAQKEEANDQ